MKARRARSLRGGTKSLRNGRLQPLPPEQIVKSAHWALISHMLDYMVPGMALERTHIASSAAEVPTNVIINPMLATTVGVDSLECGEGFAADLTCPDRQGAQHSPAGRARTCRLAKIRHGLKECAPNNTSVGTYKRAPI